MLPSQTPQWAALQAHAGQLRTVTLRELFAQDPERGTRLTAEAGGLLLDYSKQRVTVETIELLVALAEATGLAERTAAMFAGEPINNTEDRAVLHTALRLPGGAELTVNGVDVVAEVHDTLRRMGRFADAVRDGEHRGHTGETINTIVNIGIGGSDLGPRMATEALRLDRGDLDVRFVSNVDGADLDAALTGIDPARTLFIVVSKTFTTLETLTNARAAKRWVQDRVGSAATAQHFAAVSTNLESVREFGIDPNNVFPMWDWVGGRYSVDSAVGLSLMMAVGPHAFGEFLAGFHDIDEHFRTAPLDQNIPALMGLISVWNRNFLGFDTQAVVPYSSDMKLFPNYLQQLTMESNGKRVTRDGEAVDYETGEMVWGTAGTDGQHAYFQLLHQGTTVVPTDFIAFGVARHAFADQQTALVANVLAQAEALAFGKTADEVRASGVPETLVTAKTFPGNRPSNMLVAQELTPRALGQLIAAYEHRVFTQGVTWGINSFDQWGVELGKVLASEITELLEGTGAPGRDSSTTRLIEKFRAMRTRGRGGLDR
ncbi:MAG: glucose-6-phosphate isomerase [Acidimicrobiia bacterium]